MVPGRKVCMARSETGRPCRAAPLRDRPYCVMHDPDQAEAVHEAWRLGGLRRRREATVSGAYGIERFDTIDSAQRLVEIAVVDVLSLDNTIARGQALASGGPDYPEVDGGRRDGGAAPGPGVLRQTGIGI